MDESKYMVQNSKLEYMYAKKEESMFKFMDQNENIKKLKRGQSAYKKALVGKILDKANRGRDVSERRTRVSELAIQNSHMMRMQLDMGISNLTQIERNQKADL